MSFKRELDLEERLNKIASKAVREPSQEEFINPFKSSVSKPTSTSKELTDLKDLRQLTMEAQLDKIATNAIQDKLGFKPSKIKSEVTKEMILDYQNEMLKPIEIEVEDAFGNKRIKKYKYHPSSVDLDIEEYDPPNVLLNDGQKRTIRQGMSDIVNGDLADLNRAIAVVMAEIEFDKTQFDRQLGVIRVSDAKTSDKIRAIREANAIHEAFKARKEGEIFGIQLAITDVEAELQRLQNILDDNDRKISENQAEERRVKDLNAQRLKVYEDDLNLLNRGRLNVTRQPNESDVEYADRLYETGQTTANEDAMEASSELYNRDKLRELVLELVRDTGIISNAIKGLSSEQVFKINQNWSRIKRDFIKVYGFDNKTVKERDLIDFFKQEVVPIIELTNKGEAPPPPTVFGEEGFAEATVLGRPELKTYAELQKLKSDAIKSYYKAFFPTIEGEPEKLPYNPTSGKNGWTRKIDGMIDQLIAEDLVSDRNPDGSERGVIKVKKSPAKSSLSEVLSASLKKPTHSIEDLSYISTLVLNDIRADLERKFERVASEDERKTINDTIEAMDSALAGLKAKNYNQFYEGLDLMETKIPDIIRRVPEMQKIYPREITGNGLQPIKHDIPNLIEFGKVKISPRKLYYNNTLVIKHKSGNSLVGLPNVQVSDKFVSIIMNLLKGKKPSLKDFNQLDLSEKGIYDSLIYIAGLGKEVDNNFSETKQHLKNRLELIEGSIGAGNTNPALKKELHGILGKMAHTGMIGYGDAKRYYLSVTK